MNLSNDGTLKTTNIVIQNLDKLQKRQFNGLSASASELSNELNGLYQKQRLLINAVQLTIKEASNGGKSKN